MGNALTCAGTCAGGKFCLGKWCLAWLAFCCLPVCLCLCRAQMFYNISTGKCSKSTINE